METVELLKLPELPKCPKHPDGKPDGGIASCRLCWSRFYFYLEHEKHITWINNAAKDYVLRCQRITS